MILDKLDDVDGEKQKRYTRVYARLEDFEQFMVSRGVDVTMSGGDTPPLPEKHTALMTDDEALSLPMSGVSAIMRYGSPPISPPGVA